MCFFLPPLISMSDTVFIHSVLKLVSKASKNSEPNHNKEYSTLDLVYLQIYIRLSSV
jgi:hypothetical protein